MLHTYKHPFHGARILAITLFLWATTIWSCRVSFFYESQPLPPAPVIPKPTPMPSKTMGQKQPLRPQLRTELPRSQSTPALSSRCGLSKST